DYVEQIGRTERATVFPPAAFWSAAVTTITDPEVLHHIGRQAENRGRYRRAAQLYQKAVGLGSISARRSLAHLRERAGDRAGAERLCREVADCGNTFALVALALWRELAGDRAGAGA